MAIENVDGVGTSNLSLGLQTSPNTFVDTAEIMLQGAGRNRNMSAAFGREAVGSSLWLVLVSRWSMRPPPG